MVILNIQLDNLLLFHDFSMNLSYPKKPVHTTIENETLEGRSNFRYKKLVVLMGANATGKTALGKVLLGIFNFITTKEAGRIFPLIDNCMLPASFSIDFAFPDCTLYRISTIIRQKSSINDDYSSDHVAVSVRQVKILRNDSYESAAERLSKTEPVKNDYYGKTLESVPSLSWLFEDPFASDGRQRPVKPADPHLYADVLRETLQTLDPRIVNVEELPNVKNSYAIFYPHHQVLIQDGSIATPDKLSSGTKDGVGIAQIITGMKLDAYEFYYCDEKFSHVHTELEKSFLSTMIDLTGANRQLFFTTHNLDVLEMDLPRHSFAFLSRDDTSDHRISCSFASDQLKKNTGSLRNAVENDLFSTVPSTTEVYKLAEPYLGGYPE